MMDSKTAASTEPGAALSVQPRNKIIQNQCTFLSSGPEEWVVTGNRILVGGNKPITASTSCAMWYVIPAADTRKLCRVVARHPGLLWTAHPTDPDSALAAEIRDTYLRQHFEADVVGTASQALKDATSFANRDGVGELSPQVIVTSEGEIILQWRGTRYGLAILFPGDGTGVYSVRTKGKNFADNAVEFDIHSAALPAELSAAIDGVEPFLI